LAFLRSFPANKTLTLTIKQTQTSNTGVSKTWNGMEWNIKYSIEYGKHGIEYGMEYGKHGIKFKTN
jgi:hypothetical protein